MTPTLRLAALLLLAAAPLVAQQDLAPEQVRRPAARSVAPEARSVGPEARGVAPEASPEPEKAAAVAAEGIAPLTVRRPRLRPAAEPAETPPIVAAPADVFSVASATAVVQAPRPAPRPLQKVMKQALQPTIRAAAPPPDQPGLLCGVPGLDGRHVASIDGPGDCGVVDPVQLRAVSGVKLSTAVVVDCNTARALQKWIVVGAAPAVSGIGGGIASLRIAGSYVCRSRNHEPGEQLSEHAYGHAVDIAAIGLQSGAEITVSDGWRGPQGATLKQMHRAACGPFGTVLGPDANSAHHDHFHFDTAPQRSGAYCR